MSRAAAVARDALSRSSRLRGPAETSLVMPRIVVVIGAGVTHDSTRSFDRE